MNYNLVNAGSNNLIILSTPSSYYVQYPFTISKTRCAAGSSVGNYSCVTCPLKYYSITSDAESYNQCPYSAMTTPSTGTNNKSQCFNPISSFLLAIVSFMIAPFLVLVYLMQSRIHFISFMRVQSIVKRLQSTMSLFSSYIVKVGLSSNFSFF